MQNPHPHSTASCARFLIVEPTDKALNSSKSREKNAEEFMKYYMHLSVLQGKTSLLQIVTLISAPIPSCIFYFADHFQLNLSFKTFDLVI